MSWLRQFALWLVKFGVAPGAFGYYPSWRLLLAFWLLGVSGGTHVTDLMLTLSDDLDNWAEAVVVDAGAQGPTDLPVSVADDMNA